MATWRECSRTPVRTLRNPLLHSRANLCWSFSEVRPEPPKGLARKLHQEAQQRGLKSRMVAMDALPPEELTTAENVALITSTYGDGEPPDNAQAFWNKLRSDEAPTLENVKYSVLALGDTNYPAFCEFGKQCDSRLRELGAVPLHPRVDCDVDYDAPALTWREALLQSLGSGSGIGRIRKYN